MLKSGNCRELDAEWRRGEKSHSIQPSLDLGDVFLHLVSILCPFLTNYESRRSSCWLSLVKLPTPALAAFKRPKMNLVTKFSK